MHKLLLLTLAFALIAPDAFAQDDDPDRDLSVSQPDFTIVTLPTTLRLPRFKSAFRVTHRFGRPLGNGDFGDLAADLFSLDSGAQIGLEYRFGLMRGLQAGFHRTSDKTLEVFTQYNVFQQGESAPVGLGVLASIEGTSNLGMSCQRRAADGSCELRSSYSPAFGAAISRTLGSRGAVYLEPIWVNNSNPAPGELVDDNDSLLVGFGARLRVRPTVYLGGEVSPRVAGYDPGVTHGTFGIEKRAGGHTFQMNFSNGVGTTMGQVARGGFSNDEWYLGFNISRKFF